MSDEGKKADSTDAMVEEFDEEVDECGFRLTLTPNQIDGMEWLNDVISRIANTEGHANQARAKECQSALCRLFEYSTRAHGMVHAQRALQDAFLDLDRKPPTPLDFGLVPEELAEALKDIQAIKLTPEAFQKIVRAAGEALEEDEKKAAAPDPTEMN